MLAAGLEDWAAYRPASGRIAARVTVAVAGAVLASAADVAQDQDNLLLYIVIIIVRDHQIVA